MKPDTNHLSSFLKALREERGFGNIREYVQYYNLPVGYVYYTEIESGKKYLSLETANQLCQALNADPLSFYSYLLKDILPSEIQNDFLNLLPLSNISDPLQIENKQKVLRDAYQRNMLSRLNLTARSMNKEAETFFVNNPDLMPLLGAIYCTETTTDLALKETAERLGISMPIGEILANFENLSVIKISQGPDQTKIVHRLSTTITPGNQKTGAQRITVETLKALSDADLSAIPDPNASNCFYGVVGLSKQKQQDVSLLIADLIAEFNSYHQTAEGELQLMTVAFSPIKQYMIQSAVN
jgi:transcriptional regulator with XRE-family HTH domain